MTKRDPSSHPETDTWPMVSIRRSDTLADLFVPRDYTHEDVMRLYKYALSLEETQEVIYPEQDVAAMEPFEKFDDD